MVVKTANWNKFQQNSGLSSKFLFQNTNEKNGTAQVSHKSSQITAFFNTKKLGSIERWVPEIS